jgi:hypothetical protein
LGRQKDQALRCALVGGFKSERRDVARGDERHDHERENDEVANGQEREVGGEDDVLGVGREGNGRHARVTDQGRGNDE